MRIGRAFKAVMVTAKLPSELKAADVIHFIESTNSARLNAF